MRALEYWHDSRRSWYVIHAYRVGLATSVFQRAQGLYRRPNHYLWLTRKVNNW